MKKLSILLALALLLCCMAGCNNTVEPNTDNTNGSTEDTGHVQEPTGTHDGVQNLTETEDVLLDLLTIPTFEESFPTMTWLIDINESRLLKMYAGIEEKGDIIEMSIARGAIDPGMEGFVVFDLVLAKLSTSANAEATAAAMKSGLDTSFWGELPADAVRVYVVKNYIIMSTMSNDLYEDMDSVTWGNILEAYLANKK